MKWVRLDIFVDEENHSRSYVAGIDISDAKQLSEEETTEILDSYSAKRIQGALLDKKGRKLNEEDI